MDDTDIDLLARFEREHLIGNSITELRAREQLRVLWHLCESIDHPLSELTPRDVVTFMADQVGRGLNPNYVRKQHGMIRAFVSWAERSEIFDSERTEQLRLVRNPRGAIAHGVPNPYTPTDIKRLRASLVTKYPALPVEGRGAYALRRYMQGRTALLRRTLYRHTMRCQFEAQIALALEMGLRSIEIFTLTIAAMHHENDQLVVLTAKQGPNIAAKRQVPFTSHARTCVQEWLDLRDCLRLDHDFPWLMLKYGGTADEQLAPMTMHRMHRMLKPLGHWRWHRLRHTAATEWLRSGVPLEKLQIYMGHATLEQTRAYTKITNADVSEAFSRVEHDFAQRLGIA